MHVLFIHPCYENFGGYFRARGLAQALARQGIKIDLLCPQQGRFSFWIKKKVLAKNFTRYELPYWPIHFFLNGRILRGILSSFFILLRKYDLVHLYATMQIETVIPFCATKILRKKIVFDWDDYWQDSPFFHQTNKLVKKYIAFLENTIPKLTPFMTVTSDFLVQKARGSGVSRVLKIINGVDRKQFRTHTYEEGMQKLKLDPQKKYLLAFGNTYAPQRAHLLLKTLAGVQRQDPAVRLIANIDFRQLFPKTHPWNVRKKEILEQIIVTGFIPPQDLGYYLAISACVIFLTGNSAAEQSCFPIRIGSYLNGEKMIATTDTDTEWCNTLKKFHCVLLGKNTQDLAQKITALLHDQDLQKKLENNVRRAKSELTWENLAAQLLQFYRLILHH